MLHVRVTVFYINASRFLAFYPAHVYMCKQINGQDIRVEIQLPQFHNPPFARG